MPTFPLIILFGNIFITSVAKNHNFKVNEIRLDGSTQKQTSISSRNIRVVKPRVLGESEIEVDDVAEKECNKLMYTSISFMVEEAENLPVPDSPTLMYVSLLWNTDEVATATENNNTYTQAVTRTTSDTVIQTKRDADWENDGFFDFENVCGEDKIIFEIYEENSGYLSSTDSSVEKDTLIWRYSSQTAVETYYDMVGEATSCWYIERDSEPTYDTPDATYLTERDIYLKWCVKVKCNDGWSCYQPMSTWALITVLSLFLFPAPVSSYGSRRAVPQREVELEERRRSTTRNQLRPPTPPRRVNHIKNLHKETYLSKLHKAGVELGDDPVCAICLADLERSDKVKRLSCQHVFHSGCVDLWGETAHTCPLCKTDFEELTLNHGRDGDDLASSSSSTSATRIFPSFDAGMFMFRGFNRPMRVPASSFNSEEEASL